MFITAIAGLVYTILKNNNVAIEFEEYQLYIDIIVYALLGFGIYKNFGGAK